jgi:hypothetical protein
MQPKMTTFTRIRTAITSQCRMSKVSNMRIPPYAAYPSINPKPRNVKFGESVFGANTHVSGHHFMQLRISSADQEGTFTVNTLRHSLKDHVARRYDH